MSLVTPGGRRGRPARRWSRPPRGRPAGQPSWHDLRIPALLPHGRRHDGLASASAISAAAFQADSRPQSVAFGLENSGSNPTSESRPSVEEFAIGDDPGAREKAAQRDVLAPARMNQHHLRIEAHALHLQAGVDDRLRPAHLRVEAPREGMHRSRILGLLRWRSGPSTPPAFPAPSWPRWRTGGKPASCRLRAMCRYWPGKLLCTKRTSIRPAPRIGAELGARQAPPQHRMDRGMTEFIFSRRSALVRPQPRGPRGAGRIDAARPARHPG